SFSLTAFMMPDKDDSTGKGTKICCENSLGFPASFPVTAKSHSPFKFRQSDRTICGRGYSGCAFFGETSLAQRVWSGPAAGCQAFATGRVSRSARMAAGRSFWILRAVVRSFEFEFMPPALAQSATERKPL